jgi:hypothetical protein
VGDELRRHDAAGRDVTIESDQFYDMRVLKVPYFIPLHQAVKIKSHQIIPVPEGASPPRTPPSIC